MAKESDMSYFNDVLEPFRRIINTEPPKDKLSASSKLNFSDSNQSLKEGNPNLTSSYGKRPSFGMINVTPKRARTESNSSAPPPPSPWEIRRMQSDLIAAKAQITSLEGRLNQQHGICKEMQILFEEEKASLVAQHEKDVHSLSEMEDRLKFIRKREQNLKDEYTEAVKDHTEAKAKWDKQKEEYLKQIAEYKDKLLEADVSSKDQVSEMKKDMDELLQAYEGAQAEVDMLKAEVAKLTPKAEQCSTLQAQLDKQSLALQQVTNKLKELEYEKDSYIDWQQQAKTAQKRLVNMAELEKEVGRLRATERNLRDAVCNKLLLEEQVHSLTNRLEALQPIQNELHETKVKLARAESQLEEWINVGRANDADEPQKLAIAVDGILQRELDAVTQAAKAQSQLSQITEELATLRYERDKAATKLKDFQDERKNQESLIRRLQKRLLLVTRERDSYRQQLDCYEKELTVSMGAGGANAAAHSRIEQLERYIQTYREVLAAHDKEDYQKVIDNLRAEVAKWRDEAEVTKRDALKWKAQRDNMQAQLERLHVPTSKVLHLSNNPAAAAHKEFQADLESAQEEIKRLKAALKEGGGGCSEEVAALKQQLDNSRIKLQRMKEEFTSSAQEYRDVCYMLLGYKIDRTGHKNYRLSSMYAETADEYLTFTLSDDGIEMVHTDYSETLVELVELHLHHHRSIPLFLSSLTMDLFTKTTMQPEMQE